ncbi:nickel import ATP-binding protein NikD [Bradyrhizobium sp. LHD-71]|uniref:nickel import ATP-binding protein NikD n=1 Tax=Bradyrhizobium sp. LHD-71 TaxID=3072141 RepID=UPI00280F53AB|nr:nickel import ATP-binding protein NikD [Bradyrhizobium sp. LHD-71]MDQ8726974.1 nickel import ATP-binding protein NikD [Bradyrhizobium sp. LHD-71]
MTTGQLSIENLCVVTNQNGRFRTLVDGVSLDITRGRVVALVGASGSGKSLTCAASLDVLPPGVLRNTGKVLVDGTAQPFADLRGRQVASIMQNPRTAFNPVRTMRSHAIETLKANGRYGKDAHERVRSAMDDVGLSNVERVLDLHAFEMSGGMLQRVMIAVALLSDAPFLFADEPTTDLDLVLQARMLDLIEQVVRRRRLGVLLVTHDMSVVARLADEVAVIDAGKIVERGSVSQIFLKPRHAVTRRLVTAHLSLYGLQLAS